MGCEGAGGMGDPRQMVAPMLQSAAGSAFGICIEAAANRVSLQEGNRGGDYQHQPDRYVL